MLQFVPLSVTPQSSWTLRGARAALDAHETGDFSQSALLADALPRDGQMFADIQTRVRAIAARADEGGLPFEVQPSDRGDQRRAKSVAKKVKEWWWDVFTEQALTAILRDSLLLGVAVAAVEWVLQGTGSDAVRLPKIHHLPAHNLFYREWERKWFYLTEQGEVEVVPGGPAPGGASWLLHLPHGDRSFMWGAVRALGIPFVVRAFSYDDWTRYNEKHGLPALAVKEPHFASDDVNASAGANTIYQQAREMTSQAIFRLPQGEDGQTGWDAKWLELVGNTWETFQGLLKRTDSVITIVLHGRAPESAGKLGGDGEGGREQVRSEYLAADAGGLGTTTRDQVLKPWGRLNDPAWDDKLAPWGRWNTTPKANAKVRAETLDVAADAIGKLVALGADPAPLFDEFRLTKIKEPEPKPAQPVEKKPVEEEEEAA